MLFPIELSMYEIADAGLLGRYLKVGLDRERLLLRRAPAVGRAQALQKDRGAPKNREPSSMVGAGRWSVRPLARNRKGGVS